MRGRVAALSPGPANPPTRAGFTLVELALVIVLVGILVSLVAQSAGLLKRRAGAARCSANLKNLYVATGAYLNDHDGVWPQRPESASALPEEGLWWKELLAPYGASDAVWLCPSSGDDPAKARAVEDSPIHYLPTLFDDKPYTAYRWSRMPWFVEIGDFHGKGNLLVLSTGAVMPAPEAARIR